MTAAVPVSTATMPALGVPASARELDALALVIDHDAEAALNLLSSYLNGVQAGMDNGGWRQYCGGIFRRHRLFEKLQASPFASRGFKKPRGYDGDAVLLDMVYTPDVVVDKLEGLARWIFIWETGGAGARALRSRRDLFARILDEATVGGAAPRVAAIDAGHLREIQQTRLGSTGQFSKFVAFGSDPAALAAVTAQHPAARTMAGSAALGTDGLLAFHGFDLIYAPTILDAMSKADGSRLTRDLFAKLAPGGRLVLTSLTPTFPLRTYFEAALDWWIHYRTNDEMRELMSLLNPSEVAHFNVFTAGGGALTCLNVRKNT